MPDSNAGRPVWHRQPEPMEVRRAIDPETGLPFPKPTITQRIKLAMIEKLYNTFVKGWAARQLLKWIDKGLLALAGYFAISQEQTAAAYLFCASLVTAALEGGFSWASRKWLKKQPAQ